MVLLSLPLTPACFAALIKNVTLKSIVRSIPHALQSCPLFVFVNSFRGSVLSHSGSHGPRFLSVKTQQRHSQVYAEYVEKTKIQFSSHQGHLLCHLIEILLGYSFLLGKVFGHLLKCSYTIKTKFVSLGAGLFEALCEHSLCLATVLPSCFCYHG